MTYLHYSKFCLQKSFNCFNHPPAYVPWCYLGFLNHVLLGNLRKKDWWKWLLTRFHWKSMLVCTPSLLLVVWTSAWIVRERWEKVWIWANDGKTEQELLVTVSCTCVFWVMELYKLHEIKNTPQLEDCGDVTSQCLLSNISAFTIHSSATVNG